MYDLHEIHFHGDLVFFIGPNGSGKTSLLEAIHHLSFLKTFRKGNDASLIRENKDAYTLQATVQSQDTELQLHIGYQIFNNGKNIRQLSINRKKNIKISDFLGKLKIIVFTPDDLVFLDNAHSERRRFFDMLLCSLYPSYVTALQTYKRILTQRNQLLKNPIIASDSFFAALDLELARAGTEIMQKRNETIEDFRKLFRFYMDWISEGKDQWDIAYMPSLIVSTATREEYHKQLLSHLEMDKKYKQTQHGIHRDKIFFYETHRSQKDIQFFASQGQKRTAALALRMAQFDLTSSKSQETPIVLMDDVLNELDIQRKKRFIEFFQKLGQVFITTTDLAGLENFIEEQKKKSIVEIFLFSEQGKIEKQESKEFL